MVLGFLSRWNHGVHWKHQLSRGLDRILRHMAASNVLEEIAPGTFKQSAFTMALLDPVFGEWINYL